MFSFMRVERFLSTVQPLPLNVPSLKNISSYPRPSLYSQRDPTQLFTFLPFTRYQLFLIWVKDKERGLHLRVLLNDLLKPNHPQGLSVTHAFWLYHVQIMRVHDSVKGVDNNMMCVSLLKFCPHAYLAF